MCFFVSQGPRGRPGKNPIQASEPTNVDGSSNPTLSAAQKKGYLEKKKKKKAFASSGFGVYHSEVTASSWLNGVQVNEPTSATTSIRGRKKQGVRKGDRTRINNTSVDARNAAPTQESQVH